MPSSIYEKNKISILGFVGVRLKYFFPCATVNDECWVLLIDL